MGIAECTEGWEIYGVRPIGRKSWEYCRGGSGSEVGRRGMRSVGTVTARRAAAATVITYIDVYSTASCQTHSLLYFFFTLYKNKLFSHCAKKSAQRRSVV